MLRFSIIVPAYNEEKTLGQCLSSLLEQHFDRNSYEIIVVNNNSTDKTKAVALSYAGVRVIDEPRQGNVFALIEGCRQAQGEILAFTDADTQVPKDWLKKLDCVYQDNSVIAVGGPGKLRPKTCLGRIGEWFFFVGGVLTQLSPCFNLSIRKSAYQQLGGFNPRINFNQDVYLTLRAKTIGKVVFLKDNYVITSSRHFRGRQGIAYIFKGLVNIIALLLFRRTVFWDFGAVRD